MVLNPAIIVSQVQLTISNCTSHTHIQLTQLRKINNCTSFTTYNHEGFDMRSKLTPDTWHFAKIIVVAWRNIGSDEIFLLMQSTLYWNTLRQPPRNRFIDEKMFY